MTLLRKTFRYRRDDERGAYLILYALLLVAMLVMVAIVVDLAALRQDRRQQRLAADSAVTAGGLSLTRGAAGRYQACEDAWAYAAQNLGYDPTNPILTSPCTPFDPANGGGHCDPVAPQAASPRTQSGSIGQYTVEITTPVLIEDPLGTPNPLLKSDAIGGDKSQVLKTSAGIDSDGEACQRIAVRITSTRTPVFGRLAGISSNTTNNHSVARSATDDGEIRPNLVVLEPHGCDALLTNGTPSIEVIGSATLPGGAVLVSDGASCGPMPNNYVLNVGTGATKGHVTVAVNGNIYLKAQNGVCTGSACDPGQLDTPTCWNNDPALTTCTGYSPPPLGLNAPLDRSKIDYLYNCRTGYTTATGNYIDVKIDGVTMADCSVPGSDDYINALYTEVVTNNGLRPSAPTVVGTNASAPCNLTTFTTLPVLTGNYDFNCKLGNNIDLTITGDVRFRQTSFDPGNVEINGNAVFDNGVDIGTGNKLRVLGNTFFGGDLTVNGSGDALELRGATGGYPSTCQPADFVTNIASCVKSSGYTPATAGPPLIPSSGAAFSFMMGVFNHNGGNAKIDRVMVYGGTGMRLDRAGDPTLNWTPPTTGPFKKLAFWSDTTSIHEMGGGGTLNVDGTFFAPNAVFELGGSGVTQPQDAQFWALKLQAAGTGTFRLKPDPDLIPVPVGPIVRLIR